MYKVIYSVFCECCGVVTTLTQELRWNQSKKAAQRFGEIAAALEATDDLKVGFVAVSYNDNCKVAFSKIENSECTWWFDKYEPALSDRFYNAYLTTIMAQKEAA